MQKLLQLPVVVEKLHIKRTSRSIHFVNLEKYLIRKNLIIINMEFL